jgi:hypothetical protein
MFGAVNCFAAMQYKSPTALRLSRKADPELLEAQDVEHLFIWVASMKVPPSTQIYLVRIGIGGVRGWSLDT